MRPQSPVPKTLISSPQTPRKTIQLQQPGDRPYSHMTSRGTVLIHPAAGRCMRSTLARPDLPYQRHPLGAHICTRLRVPATQQVRGDAMNPSQAGASSARAGTHEARARVRGLCCLAQERDSGVFSGYPCSPISSVVHSGTVIDTLRGTRSSGGVGQIGSHDRSERRIMIHDLSWPVWRRLRR